VITQIKDAKGTGIVALCFDTRNLLVFARISAANTFDFSRLDVQIDRIRVT
jgi:hypothetical protein